MNMKNNVVITVVVLIVGVGAFFGGMKYQETKSARAQSARQFPGGGRQGGNGQGRFGGGAGRPVVGEILVQDDKSITVKLQDGSSKIVLVSDKTTINKATEASKDDLKTGVRVAATGTENSDGSVTAISIQVNPLFGGLGGRLPNRVAKSPDAKEIIVEGSNYSFTPNKITVKKGEKTRVVFKNKDGIHDFRVDELGIMTAAVRSGEEDFVEFTPQKTGQFEFYCSVDGHRQMGMIGTLVVQ